MKGFDLSIKYKRILLKLSGEVMGGDKSASFDADAIKQIVDSVVSVRKLGIQVGLVVGGGNIFRGARSTAYPIDRVSGDYMGMLATVINSICLQEALEQCNVETRVMTAIEMRAIAEPYIKRRAVRHLEKGRIVIFAAGTGNPFFTTDTTAALRASEIGAEVLIKATKTDGVYDKDPNIYDDAKRYHELSFTTVLSQNLRVMDLTAIALCKDNNLPILVVNIGTDIVHAVEGKTVGTIIN